MHTILIAIFKANFSHPAAHRFSSISSAKNLWVQVFTGWLLFLSARQQALKGTVPFQLYLLDVK